MQQEYRYLIMSLESIKFELDAAPFVNQVFIDTPSQDVSNAFPYYSRCDPSEVAYEPIILVYSIDCRKQPFVVLSDVFIIELEEDSGPDDVEGVGDYAAEEVGGERGQGGYQRQLEHSLLVLLQVRVNLQHSLVKKLAVLIDGEENS